ncbi:MAG: hypothetical protein WC067_02580 [Candidatus Methanomethylophilaceae archaeon]
MEAMGLLDKMDNKIKTFGSKQQESSEISAINKKIRDEEVKINLSTSDIGEYYWNEYADGKFTPTGDSLGLFKGIEDSLKLIEEYKNDIESRKNTGEEERRRINEETRKIEEQKRKDAEARRKAAEAERIRKEREEIK